MGVDFRLNSSFTPDGYQPVTAQFHLQDDWDAKPFPWLDVFMAFKVKTFRFFVRYENLATFWDDETVFYQSSPLSAAIRGASFRAWVGVLWTTTNKSHPTTVQVRETPRRPSRDNGFSAHWPIG